MLQKEKKSDNDDAADKDGGDDATNRDES